MSKWYYAFDKTHKIVEHRDNPNENYDLWLIKVSVSVHQS